MCDGSVSETTLSYPSGRRLEGKGGKKGGKRRGEGNKGSPHPRLKNPPRKKGKPRFWSTEQNMAGTRCPVFLWGRR